MMFIYRPDPDNVEEVKIDIQKHRNGPTGEIDMMFKGERVKFYGMERRRKKEPAKEGASAVAA